MRFISRIDELDLAFTGHRSGIEIGVNWTPCGFPDSPLLCGSFELLYGRRVMLINLLRSSISRHNCTEEGRQSMLKMRWWTAGTERASEKSRPLGKEETPGIESM